MKKEQTAVEWLWEKLLNAEFINSPDELFERAKEMEEEQKDRAMSDGYNLAKGHATKTNEE